MTWTLDPHHTSVTFSAKHLGVATVRGRFDQVAADLELDDANDPTTGRGTVTSRPPASPPARSSATVTSKRRLPGRRALPEIVFTLKSVKETAATTSR